ncbi:transposase [Sinorhizobium prairiense]|uniref:transposase n=1 Tax=unclassified Sinorhizobium TaxID=2613772 RepID=UPI0023D82297|nr:MULTISPECIES: transposase [unclassified Sinorhizobium]WEJ14063.1 transposase [Sinorhizobium sp. K101]WEJ35664.1 transposase [Sinorhizobium sp. C101]
MADESNAAPVAVAGATDAEVKAPTAKKQRSPRRPKAAAEPVPAQSKAPAAKRRGYSEQEKGEKLKLIETQVTGGSTLKDAIKSAGISEQTYYQWKGAAKPVEKKGTKGTKPIPAGDELADLVQLEEENQRLRKKLAEKLRAENAELRKRLGLN